MRIETRGLFAAALAVCLAAGAARAQPAGAPPPDRLALAHRLVEASGGAREVEARLRSMFMLSTQVITKDLPPAQARLQGLIQQDMLNEMSALIPSMLAETERSYARHLTSRELQDLVAWEESPSGRAIRAKSPAIRAEVLSAEGPALRQLAPAVMRKTLQHVCQQISCTPGDRKVLAAIAARQGGAPDPSAG